MMRYTRSFLGLLMFLAISAEGLAGLWTTNEFIYKPSQGARGEREKSTYDSGLDRVDVRLAKEVWVGDPKFGATLQDAITALGANTAVLRIPKGTYNLDTNLTIPYNITLKPEPGAILAIATTKTLTINGKLEAGLEQVFSCAGTGKVVFAAGSNQTIVPQWWGASSSASAAVNTAAIQASLNALVDFTSWTLPPGDYICNASLVIGDYATTVFGLHLDFKGRLRFDGCSGLDVRNIFNSSLKGIYVKRTTQDWSDDTTTTDFGFKIGAGRHCKIEILHSEDFSYGIWLDGDARYNAYLDFSLGYITENKYGMYITWLNGGWNNENNYHGGTFTSNKAVLTPNTKLNTTDNNITLDAGWPSTYVTGYAVYFTLGESDYTIPPAPLTIGTKYYVIRDSSTVIKLAASYADAMAGTAIDLTSQGNSTLRFGKAGSWGVRFYGSGSSFDNHRWYGTAFESLHNGMYLAGYAGGRQMFLYAPRFECVANWIEAAPRQLTWEVGALSLERTSMQKYCPRMIGSDEKSTVTIKGIGYYDLDAYQPYATPKDALGDTSYAKGGAFTFYNPLALEQTTNWKNQVKDYFTLQVNELVADTGGTTSRHTKYFPMNKGFEGTAGPTAGIEYPMTYAKNAVVWNTNVASGQPMGWVCSKSGSVVRASSITGTGNVTGTTLTVTAGTSTKYLFAGAFLLIDGVQHQIKKVVSYDAATSLGVYELYANNLGGNVTGKAIANDPPTWVAMADLDTMTAGGAWGCITGTLTDQTDLIALLGGANIPSPTEFGYVKGLSSAVQTQLNAKADKYPTAAAGGTVDAITATYSPAVTLTNGTRAILVAAGANTGAVTFVPNGIASKAIVKVSATPLVAGDIPGANYPCDLQYNGTAWVLLNPAIETRLGGASAPSAADLTLVKEGSAGGFDARLDDLETNMVDASVFTAIGDLITFSAAGVPARLPAHATPGYVLTSNGAAAQPTYQAPTIITVEAETSDTTCFPLFVSDATGDRAPKTNTGLTYNASSQILHSEYLNGFLSGPGASCQGNTSIAFLGTDMTTTSRDGLLTSASNEASAGTPVRMSPRVRLAANAWDTTALSGKWHSWFFEVLPATGSVTTSKLRIAKDEGIGLGSAVYILDIENSGKLAGLATTNGPTGTCTLAASTSTTVNNTCVTANSRIFLQATNSGSAAHVGNAASVYISAKNAATSFVITHPSAAGTETFDYWIVN